MAVYKTGESEPNWAVVGLQEDQVKKALDRLRATPAGEPFAPESGSIADEAPGAFFTVSVKLDDEAVRALMEIPEQHSAVVKMLQRVTVSLGAEEESVVLQVSVDVVDEKRAEQIQQLAQGAAAFWQLPLENLKKDKKFTKVQKLLSDLTVSRSGNRVTCRLSRPATTVISHDYVAVLTAWRHGEVRLEISVHDFYFALARLGGHQNRTHDKRPGWLVLWRGWIKLQSMLDGYLAARRKRCG